MKKTFLVICTLTIALLGQTKETVLVVKGTTPSTKGKSDVYVSQGNGNDTVVVVPKVGTTTIKVKLIGPDGDTLSTHVLSAKDDSETEVETSDGIEQNAVEISDDENVIYMI